MKSPSSFDPRHWKFVVWSYDENLELWSPSGFDTFGEAQDFANEGWGTVLTLVAKWEAIFPDAGDDE